MTSTFKAIAAALMAAGAFGAQAGTQTGTISQLTVRASDGLIILYMNGTPSDRATCAAHQPYWMIKDENSTSGKQQLAQLVTAYAAGRTVNIVGMGTCTRWGDGEDIDLVNLL